MIDFIKTGNKIEIIRISNRNTDKGYISQVEEVLSPNSISAQVPISYGQLLRLPLKLRYNFIFYTNRGMISYEGTITSYFREEEMYLMKLTLASEGELIQKREFFRFTCSLPFRFRAIDENDEDIVNSMLDGLTNDISGGGMRFVSRENVSDIEKLEFVIDLNGEMLVVLGRVVEKLFLKDAKYNYQYRIKYLGIQKQDQEKIIKYIFSEQRRQLRVYK